MDLEASRLSEISQTEKDKHHMISLTCGILKKSPPDLQRTNWWLPETGARDG